MCCAELCCGVLCTCGCHLQVHIKNLFSLRVHAKHLAGFKPEDMHAKALRNAAAARKRARPIL